MHDKIKKNELQRGSLNRANLHQFENQSYGFNDNRIESHAVTQMQIAADEFVSIKKPTIESTNVVQRVLTIGESEKMKKTSDEEDSDEVKEEFDPTQELTEGNAPSELRKALNKGKNKKHKKHILAVLNLWRTSKNEFNKSNWAVAVGNARVAKLEDISEGESSSEDMAIANSRSPRTSTVSFEEEALVPVDEEYDLLKALNADEEQNFARPANKNIERRDLDALTDILEIPSRVCTAILDVSPLELDDDLPNFLLSANSEAESMLQECQQLAKLAKSSSNLTSSGFLQKLVRMSKRSDSILRENKKKLHVVTEEEDFQSEIFHGLHAEMQMIQKLFKSGWIEISEAQDTEEENVIPLYISISRKCCAMCEHTIKALNNTNVLLKSGKKTGSKIKFETRGSHRTFYPKAWPPPEFLLTNESLMYRVLGNELTTKCMTKDDFKDRREILLSALEDVSVEDAKSLILHQGSTALSDSEAEDSYDEQLGRSKKGIVHLVNTNQRKQAFFLSEEAYKNAQELTLKYWEEIGFTEHVNKHKKIRDKIKNTKQPESKNDPVEDSPVRGRNKRKGKSHKPAPKEASFEHRKLILAAFEKGVEKQKNAKESEKLNSDIISKDEEVDK